MTFRISIKYQPNPLAATSVATRIGDFPFLNSELKKKTLKLISDRWEEYRCDLFVSTNLARPNPAHFVTCRHECSSQAN